MVTRKEPEQPTTAPTASENKPLFQKMPGAPDKLPNPQAFTPTMGNLKIKACYDAAMKNLSGKEVFWLHKKIRDDQMRCLEAIQYQLSNDTESTPEDRNKIFMDVLQLTRAHIEKEFRFFSRESQLVKILNEEIDALQKPNLKTETETVPENPAQAYGSATNPAQFFAFLEESKGNHPKISLKTAGIIKENMDKLLKPHGFLQAVMDFIKHVKHTAPKDPNNCRPKT